MSAAGRRPLAVGNWHPFSRRPPVAGWRKGVELRIPLIATRTAAAPAANARAAERPALKVVFRMPNSGNAIVSGSAASGDAQLEEWFSHEFGGNPNASNASNA